MSEPGDHHYLPVFYLKQWAGLDGRVVRYYRPHDKVVASAISPKNTGYERGLYRLKGYTTEQENVIEKAFMAAAVDTPAAAALRVLLERDQGALTLQVRLAWTRFLMALHVRNPARVGKITEQAAEHLRQVFLANPEEYQAARTPGDPSTLLAWVEENAPHVLENYGKQLLPGIIQHQETANEIIRMRWGVFELSGATPDFLTSDRPLYLSHGVQDERCLMALPICPWAVFFASCKQEIIDKVINRDADAVRRIVNETMIGQADRYVYGAHDRHLAFVESRLPMREIASVPKTG